jgi:subtilase family serine protease
LDDAETVSFTLGLQWRDSAGLTGLISDLYDRHSSRFHRFLDPDSFVAEYGPSQADVDQIQAYVQAKGLNVVQVAPNRLYVTVSGTASAVRKALGVTLNRYRRADGSTFRSPDRAASVELELPGLHAGGLDTSARARPRVRRHLSTGAGRRTSSNGGTGDSGAFWGNDFRSAYCNGISSSLNGSGQVIGLIEFEGFYSADLLRYLAATGVSASLPATHLLDGATGRPDASDPDGNDEVSLDIELAMAMAPGATVGVWEVPDSIDTAKGFNDMLASMATLKPLCLQISSSWYWEGYDPSASDTPAMLQELAAQGQAFFEASGDDGAYGSGNMDTDFYPPTTLSTLDTEVGGTELFTASAGGAWSSETTWDDYSSGPPAVGGSSGGGICTEQSIPSYQSGVSMSTNGGSTSSRNVPDVSMIAEDFEIYSENSSDPAYLDGTSGAAPLWASFIALVNEQGASKGISPLGFANPAFYGVGESAAYSTAFHDIADNSQNNANGASPNCFKAVAGYDLCTGWGSPNGIGMLNALLAEISIVGTSGGSGNPGVNFISYPNPFHSSKGGTLALRFQGTGGTATFEVFDQAYRRVATRTLDPNLAPLGAGTYDGKDDSGKFLAPGAYFAVVTGSGTPQTCKFTVIP